MSEVLDPPAAPRPSWGWGELGLVLLIFIGGGAGLLIGLRMAAPLLGWDDDAGFLSPAAYAAGAGIYLVLVGAIFGVIGRRAGLGALGLRWPSLIDLALVPPTFLVGMVGLVVMNSAVALALGEFENPQVAALSGGAAFGPGGLIALLLLVAGLVPFAEELLFRGVIHPLLRRRLGPLATVLGGGLIFAVVHLIPQLVPGLFVAGICLGFLRERSGSIWPSVLFHMLQNTVAVLAIAALLATGGA